MWIKNETIYNVEYGDLDESRVDEVDAAIAKVQEQVDKEDWDTTEQWSVGFDEEGKLIWLSAWGLLSDGSLHKMEFNL